MNNKGYTKVELLVFLGIFTIIYFVIANKISYNFNVDYEKEMYAMTLKSIKRQSKLYGKYTKNLFKDKKDVYITVNDLAEKGYLTTDEDGNVEDPRNTDKTLNDVKIKITNKDDKISVKILG